MNIIHPSLGRGLKFTDDHKMTLNIDPTVNIQKRTNGVYVDASSLGGGIEGSIDDHTIKVVDHNGNGDSILGINRDVVVCVFSMCQYKVTNRSNKNAYAVSNVVKTIDDIAEELNAVINAYGSIGIPMGVPHAAYTLKVGDFFQLRDRAYPYQYTSATETWPVAVDEGNRYEGIPITAFFYVTSVSYDYDMKVTGLTLQCLWSSLANYIAGTSYTYTETP